MLEELDVPLQNLESALKAYVITALYTSVSGPESECYWPRWSSVIKSPRRFAVQPGREQG